MLSGEQRRFHYRLNAAAPQLQNSHAERYQTTNRNLCRECDMLLKLNFFQLVERCHYRGDILIMNYWIDTHVLKNGNAHAIESGVKR